MAEPQREQQQVDTIGIGYATIREGNSQKNCHLRDLSGERDIVHGFLDFVTHKMGPLVGCLKY